jgi:outer membrane protein OmpA-like peptidoglycan-associated protein
MKRSFLVLMCVPMAFGAMACAGEQVPPPALVDARADFAKSRDGTANQLDPTDVHEADIALRRAEKAWSDSPDDPSTIDLALIADRKALIAQSEADAIAAQQQAQQAKTQYEAARDAQLHNAQGQLGQTQAQLQLSQQQQADQARRMQDLEAKLKSARDTIAKIASVKDDPRGMVITLQGEVLFKTGKYDLRPAAMAKLDQIADALKGQDQPIVVDGFTDTVGPRDYNMTLSQNRAQAVRDYLVSKGIPSELVSAKGFGPDQPVADNGSVEGRAQNRRVEIVVQPKN